MRAGLCCCAVLLAACACAAGTRHGPNPVGDALSAQRLPQAGAPSASEKAALRPSSYRIARWSSVAEGNVLPGFLFMQGAEEGGSTQVPLGGGRGAPLAFSPSEGADDDIWELDSEDMRSPPLPYLLQDRWGCERRPKEVPSLVLEDSGARATVLPSLGGKVWSLVTKRGVKGDVQEKEVLFANPAHQPANIGALKVRVGKPDQPSDISAWAFTS